MEGGKQRRRLVRVPPAPPAARIVEPPKRAALAVDPAARIPNRAALAWAALAVARSDTDDSDDPDDSEHAEGPDSEDADGSDSEDADGSGYEGYCSDDLEDSDVLGYDFDMGGHGGWGYITTIKKGDPDPPLAALVRRGAHLTALQRCLADAIDHPVEEAPAKTRKKRKRKKPGRDAPSAAATEQPWAPGPVEARDRARRVCVNASRRRDEVDYKASGFAKEWEWHSLTPLALAAAAGRADVVEWLLRELADPTLEGSDDDNVNETAFKAAQRGSNARCVALLEAARPFWRRPDYAGVSFSRKRRECGYSNAPTNEARLLAAIAAVPALTTPVADT